MDKDEMLKLCIQQGYVPNDCKLQGELVFFLIKEGKNPCVGCNMNSCSHRKAEKGIPYIYIKNKEDLDKRKRAEKRENLGTNALPILYVDTDVTRGRNWVVRLTVMHPMSERNYIGMVNDISTAAQFIPSVCYQYGVKQVFIDVNGFGMGIMDYIEGYKINVDNIDIVPMRHSPMPLL